MTKISIIVPFYNVEGYIEKCIKSLISQTIEDIEIICIDDESTDNSKEIVLRYANVDKRIKLISTQKHLGQSSARNLGLEIAEGEYIGFVDSDDWVESNMYEKMYNLAISKNTDITMCQAFLYDDKTQECYTNDYYNLKELEKFKDNVFSPLDTKNEILKINIVLWNKIYKKDFLKKINVKFVDGYIYEDLPFFFETYLKAKRINILWENLYYYRENRNYSTMQSIDQKVYNRIPMVEKTYEILKQSEFFEEKKIDIISWIIDDIFHRYTVLDDKYYEEYYKKMKDLFSKISLTEEDKEKLKTSYCYEEFCAILKSTYYEFWKFLIEKYKSTNKRIKAAEHKCNLDIKAIKEYLEKYKKEEQEEKENIKSWWQNHCEEEKNKVLEIEREYYRKEKKQVETWWQSHCEEEKNKAIEIERENYRKEKEQTEKWWQNHCEEEKNKVETWWQSHCNEMQNDYEKQLKEQKEYYERKYLLVKICLKICRLFEKVRNKIKKI